MNILITGNMGYIGPSVVGRLRRCCPDAKLVGYDMGYFATCLTNSTILPECRVDEQYFADVRKFPPELLDDIDAVVYLSAISNDPMGKTFEEVTYDVNCRSCVQIATYARRLGVKSFILASSCSMYGSADERPRTEDFPLNPLTAYAKSKVMCEESLAPLASDDFVVSALRFSTACGMSERLRLDLVLNDFVACAVTTGKINVLSDGSPWRPLINVKDMASAIDWAIHRTPDTGGNFLAVNVGSNDWNYQVKTIAQTVADCIEGVSVSINRNAQPDKRSYKVCFDLYEKLAPNHQPQYDLKTTIMELQTGLKNIRSLDGNFHESRLMRLKMLNFLTSENLLTDKLEWQNL